MYIREKTDESNSEDRGSLKRSPGGHLSPTRESEERRAIAAMPPCLDSTSSQTRTRRAESPEGDSTRAAMPPCIDSTTSQNRKRSAESPEGNSIARESSRLRLDDLTEQPEKARYRSVDGTNESSVLAASDDFDPRPLSPASLRRSWVQQSIARGGKIGYIVEHETAYSSRCGYMLVNLTTFWSASSLLIGDLSHFLSSFLGGSFLSQTST
jgi:hypothetical protein